MSNIISSWPKKITVDKRIVTILSGSTYDNFPKALKELITNSYDADSSEVIILVDINREIITVEDNGLGMNESDFDFYLRIAGKTRNKNEFTNSGRKRIGQFGVGFLSVFPFCKSYSIESKKKGSSEIIFASIPNHKFLSGERLLDVDEIPIQGGKKIDKSLIDKQFTRIKLSGFSGLTHAFFNEAYRINNRRDSTLVYPALKRLSWELSEDLPLKFENNEELNSKFAYKSSIPFRVLLNSKELYRNLQATNILETHQGEFDRIGKIKFKFFIATSYLPVKPVEARYLKIRNLNVGVGKREAFGVGLEGRTFARLAHLTGEVHILDGMNDLINVSRDGFNFSPDYEELQEFFRRKLRKWGYELDELADTEKVGNDSDNKKKLKSIEVIDKESIDKRIEKLKNKGYQVSKRNDLVGDAPFRIDKAKKIVYVPEEVNHYKGKSIEIAKKNYLLKLDAWNDDTYPACRIKGKSIFVNKSYVLFSNKKFVDIFMKTIVILTMNMDNGKISKRAYAEILKELEDTFIDY